ncbi:hypothetical protein Aph02nite_76930 [Actinoplanes philippinensis]|uniref:hypothetical protein n=1 Tax=Actinoplanes philippinensis TaxID=35752 RepID=UPI000B8097CC|nr:hypothetical protein [Actinoplanes philippinensis]GIE81743.1 hypothetical protein Aph02nite_76930 [Actinoplanes philippinensis]
MGNSERLIENQIHNVRDVTFREDLHVARTGTGPAVMATLRNTAIGWHRINGEASVARANRRVDRRSNDLITAVTSSYPNMQCSGPAGCGAGAFLRVVDRLLERVPAHDADQWPRADEVDRAWPGAFESGGAPRREWDDARVRLLS